MSASSSKNLPVEQNMSRRRLLGGIIGTTAVLTGLPSPATGGDEDPAITALSSRMITRRLASMMFDTEARALHRDLRNDGWRPQFTETVGHRAPESAEQDTYDVLALPYHKPGRSKEAVLLWTDNEAIKTQTRRIHREDRYSLDMATTTVGVDGLTTTTISVTLEIWWIFCDVNWSCVFSIAGAWAGSVASCATCLAEPTRISCLSCAGSVASAVGSTLGCDICD